MWIGTAGLSPIAAAATTPPRLAVVISIDQCRADYLERFRPFFGEGGFERLLSNGTVYTGARHRHAVTKTAPGHAVLLTGVCANIHGIISNEWIDPATFVMCSAVEDAEAPLVGLAGDKPLPPALAAKAGCSPRRSVTSSSCGTAA